MSRAHVFLYKPAVGSRPQLARLIKQSQKKTVEVQDEVTYQPLICWFKSLTCCHAAKGDSRRQILLKSSCVSILPLCKHYWKCVGVAMEISPPHTHRRSTAPRGKQTNSGTQSRTNAWLFYFFYSLTGKLLPTQLSSPKETHPAPAEHTIQTGLRGYLKKISC